MGPANRVNIDSNASHVNFDNPAATNADSDLDAASPIAHIAVTTRARMTNRRMKNTLPTLPVNRRIRQFRQSAEDSRSPYMCKCRRLGAHPVVPR